MCQPQLQQPKQDRSGSDTGMLLTDCARRTCAAPKDGYGFRSIVGLVVWCIELRIGLNKLRYAGYPTGNFVATATTIQIHLQTAPTDRLLRPPEPFQYTKVRYYLQLPIPKLKTHHIHSLPEPLAR